jgi:hypothetical protein
MQVVREHDPVAVLPELRLLEDVARYRRRRARLWYRVRALGASSLLAVGAVHLQQYFYLYSAIPTIGTLFVLNFAAATVIGLGLLAPVERVLGRFGEAVVVLLALAGTAHAASSFVFLLVAERTPLFGFQEPGYDPPALMASRVSELVTVALLGTFLAAPSWKRRRPATRGGRPVVSCRKR